VGASNKEAWEEWRFEPKRFFEAGDQAVVLVRVVARGGPSSISFDRETAHLWTLVDGRVTRCEVYLDPSEVALEALRPQARAGRERCFLTTAGAAWSAIARRLTPPLVRSESRRGAARTTASVARAGAAGCPG
jgi:hypothetical protein